MSAQIVDLARVVDDNLPVECPRGDPVADAVALIRALRTERDEARARVRALSAHKGAT